MFGKVKCSGCKTKIKKQDATEVILQTAVGPKSVFYCVPCMTYIDSELKLI